MTEEKTNKKPARFYPNDSLKPLAAVLAGIGILGLSYLFQMNSLIVKNYELDKCKEDLAVAKSESKDLEMVIVSAKSPQYLKSLLGDFNLVEVEQISYLKSRQEVVSVK